MHSLTLPLDKLAHTAILGSALSDMLRSGDIVRLEGTLGAGKTTLAREIILAQCGPVEVPSPTFTLVETYEGKSFSIWHFDLYRLNTPAEIWELGFEDAIEEGVCLIEWPQQGGSHIPDSALTIEITLSEDRRVALISGAGHWRDQLERLADAFENHSKQIA